jgi:nucleoside-diphosphate-sugar epimerase
VTVQTTPVYQEAGLVSVSGSATFFTADLRTGQGIEPAVTAATAIIHCATGTKGHAEATRNLVAAASRTGSAHLVYVSIAGIDHIASWRYPKPSRFPWRRCHRASPSSRLIPPTWRAGSSSWRWASPPAGRRTWPDHM